MDKNHLAVAYSVKRKNRKKLMSGSPDENAAVKMAQGGMIKDDPMDMDMLNKGRPDDPSDLDMPASLDIRSGHEMDMDDLEHMSIADMVRHKAMKMARGGMATMEMPDDIMEDAGHETDLDMMESPSEMVMRRRMSAGGKVMGPDEGESAPDDNAIEQPNYYDKLNRNLGGREMYSEESALDDLDAGDGGQDARDIEGDDMDMVSKIRRKYAKR